MKSAWKSSSWKWFKKSKWKLLSLEHTFLLTNAEMQSNARERASGVSQMTSTVQSFVIRMVILFYCFHYFIFFVPLWMLVSRDFVLAFPLYTEHFIRYICYWHWKTCEILPVALLFAGPCIIDKYLFTHHVNEWENEEEEKDKKNKLPLVSFYGEENVSIFFHWLWLAELLRFFFYFFGQNYWWNWFYWLFIDLNLILIFFSKLFSIFLKRSFYFYFI